MISTDAKAINQKLSTTARRENWCQVAIAVDLMAKLHANIYLQLCCCVW
ncbi:MAG: hypothetical protein ACHBN1_26705 [Heteroscytonema crispum UTEX LB 1556]